MSLRDGTSSVFIYSTTQLCMECTLYKVSFDDTFSYKHKSSSRSTFTSFQLFSKRLIRCKSFKETFKLVFGYLPSLIQGYNVIQFQVIFKLYVEFKIFKSSNVIGAYSKSILFTVFWALTYILFLNVHWLFLVYIIYENLIAHN